MLRLIAILLFAFLVSLTVAQDQAAGSSALVLEDGTPLKIADAIAKLRRMRD